MKNILAALMFFTKLPFWRIATVDKDHFRNVVHYWPFAGIVTGGIGAGVMFGASFVFPVTVAVIFGVAARVLVTGALHEDGLADFFDGFGGGNTKEDVLRIMKDSHIGSYGVLGLVLYFALLVAILSSLPVKAAVLLFFVGDILCKGVSGSIVNLLPYARDEHGSKNKVVYNRIPMPLALFVKVLLLAMCVFVYGMLLPRCMAFAVVAPVVVLWVLSSYMRRRIGGYTGDCCGAMFLLSELSFLVASLGIIHFI